MPSLVEAIKVAGLVLIADSTSATQYRETGSGAGIIRDTSEVPSKDQSEIARRVDGALEANGVLRFHETVDVQ